jgi:hypothetical protein
MTRGGDPVPSSTAKAEREIERTRAALGLTLDALSRQLAPRRLVEKGFDMFKDSLPVNETLNRSLDAIRANPIPVALIGIGAAWLIVANTDLVDRIARDERLAAARERVGDLASTLASTIGTRAGELASDVAGRVGLGSDSTSSAARPLGHTGHPMVDGAEGGRTEGWIHQMADMTEGALRSARDSGGAMLNRAGSLAGDGANRVADRLSEAFERHPLMVGAVGVIAGVLLAALLPVTRLESRLLGDTGDEPERKADATARQAMLADA